MAGMISTYVTFNGYTADVFRHWQEVFGGDLNLMTYGSMSTEGFPFDPPLDAVAHAVLTLPGGMISGGDSLGEELPIRDTAYSLLYYAENVDEAHARIEALTAAGGTVSMPFEKAPWGGWYGQVFDKYGVMWSFGTEERG